jgi:uncharacterized membrane protein
MAKRAKTKAAKTKTVKPKAAKPKEHNVLAALSYIIWPLALVLIVVEETKKSASDRHLRHHAYNAMGFFVAWFVLWILIETLSRILFAPFEMTKVFLAAAIIAIAIIFALRAYRRDEVVVPFITPFLKRNVKGF